MPAWVEKEDSSGFLVVFGSEPPKDAKSEWVPRESIQNCVYSPLTSETDSKRMAILVMNENELPEKIRQILESKK